VRLLVAVAVIVCSVMLAACSASPPPPQQQSKVPDTAAQAGKDTIYVGIDSVGPGLNPHLSADQSSATSAVAALTLPSAFRPVLGADGQTVWRMDSSLLISADTTGGPAVDPAAPDGGPFTVTYKIQQNAQWSDGQPITADDFRYLWQQMVQRAGVVAPAGYRLIKDMRSTNGGKQVAVEFTAPYPDWRQLFSALLPSHTFGGSSNGFTTGLDGGLPESGGPYKISNIDRSRDEISLQRNDRYWMTPAITNSIVLRRANSMQLIESMRNGDTRVAAVSSGRALQAQLTSDHRSAHRVGRRTARHGRHREYPLARDGRHPFPRSGSRLARPAAADLRRRIRHRHSARGERGARAQRPQATSRCRVRNGTGRRWIRSSPRPD
jgi:ABC-type transport system substrate-binding protein